MRWCIDGIGESEGWAAPDFDDSGWTMVTVPEAEYVLTVSVVRPTGFTVIERSYNSKGELLQPESSFP